MTEKKKISDLSRTNTVRIRIARRSYTRKQPTLKALLEAHFEECDIQVGRQRKQSNEDYLVVWGKKKSGSRMAKEAEDRGIGVLRCEDGFIRSIRPSDEGPYGLAIDDIGIYYDASKESRLEVLIKQGKTDDELQRGKDIIRLLRETGVSKYNNKRDQQPFEEPYVLVVDQTAGDLSIQKGMATTGSFQKMVEIALAENEIAKVVIRVHPDVTAGKKKGCIDIKRWEKNPRIEIDDSGHHPTNALRGAAAVYTVTSQLGLEALIHGKRVKVFGCPFYAGWGLTEDYGHRCKRRILKEKLKLEALVHATLVEYCSYICPITHKRIEVEELIRKISFHRTKCASDPAKAVANGFQRWKKPVLRRLMPFTEIKFKRSGSITEAPLISWGKSRNNKEADIYVEDGFLRSVGLGAELIRPTSWLFDHAGLHYECKRDSELRRALRDMPLSSRDIERGQALRKRLVGSGLTKYNILGEPWRRPESDRKVIAVMGQVEDDQSIKHGNMGICLNLDLVRAVRRLEPNAYLVYKPHPDVEAGLRRPDRGYKEISSLVNDIATKVDIESLMQNVDAVHVNTSTAGLEALIRGLEVNVWGAPFYHGLGLTIDHCAKDRVEKGRSIDELIYIAMIWYPRYISQQSGWVINVEEALDEMVEIRSKKTRGQSIKRVLLRGHAKIKQIASESHRSDIKA
ncbi:MAG: capsular polysaccharide biosynthesis protein [Synechococcus sp. WH 8007]|nr:capsular polysaccharide biosynthesis protein [Synechococcus sp. WH 8007]